MERDPKHRECYAAVRRAWRSGKLQRPTRCSNCGAGADEVVIDAHHDDYSKPLQVTYLCRKCHRQWHAALDANKDQHELPGLELETHRQRINEIDAGDGTKASGGVRGESALKGSKQEAF